MSASHRSCYTVCNNIVSAVFRLHCQKPSSAESCSSADGHHVSLGRKQSLLDKHVDERKNFIQNFNNFTLLFSNIVLDI
ncbi:hypothetical protein T4C_2434 [Trichinella pseudospiralis]|uniref:Uncharacterized protein n=1 Tax=Trichinella pseudospiralis TaxID=6337 RepID=A0A0V1J171_TRIPS|nr:hypothetical protein T4C_2434 [Trichinella pseudospiralis]